MYYPCFSILDENGGVKFVIEKERFIPSKKEKKKKKKKKRDLWLVWFRVVLSDMIQNS